MAEEEEVVAGTSLDTQATHKLLIILMDLMCVHMRENCFIV